MELDNILVRQKDSIIGMINDGHFIEALCVLQVVRELWIESGYAYKMNEMLNRVYDDERIVSDDMRKIDSLCLDMFISEPELSTSLGRVVIV